MSFLYIALVNTPGIFASLIRWKVQIPYVHVVLSLDARLEEAYTFGRRNPRVPLLSGFTKENPRAVLAAFPGAQYKIFRVACTAAQKDWLAKELAKYYARRHRYHYCLLGLPFIALNKPFYQRRRYTCSSFIARKLDQAGVTRFGKHFSLVTPKDFYEYGLGETVYKGSLQAFINHRDDAPQRLAF